MNIPPRMKAAVSANYGPPESVRIEEVDTPTPGDDQLLVKVHASTVNRTDCGYRGGKPFIIRFWSGVRRPKEPIFGTEFAGEVVAIGGAVTEFAVGDKVCGWCEPFGAHAEYLAVRASRLIMKLPAGRTFEEAAPSTEGSHYALSTFRGAKSERGHDVLIYGATGSIGSAAVQIAKNLGMNVTAVCGTEHVELVRGLGADSVIDYQTEDFTKDHQKYDLVFDAVGKSSFRRCRRLLKPKGIYSSSDVGLMWHGPILALITPLFRGRKQLFTIPKADPEGMKYLKRFIESGEYKPLLDRTYPLDQIVEAYRRAESGQKVGNIVLTMGSHAGLPSTGG